MLLPVLGALIAAAVFLYRRFSHTPQELCTYAMLNAFSYGAGYDAPVGSAMQLRELVEILQSGTVGLRWDIQLDETNIDLNEDLPAGLLGDMTLPDANLLSGAGIRVETDIFAREAVSSRIYASYGVLRFQLLHAYGARSSLALSSPELSEDVLVVSPDALFANWEALPQWDWMDEELRALLQSGILIVEDGVERAQERVETGRQIFSTFYDTTGEFLEELLASFSYEEIEKGDAATQRFYTGGKKQTCQGYRMKIDADRLSESIRRALGLSEEMFRLEAEDGGDICFVLYLTKKAELAKLSGSCRVWVGDACLPLSVSAEFSGVQHTADNFLVTVLAGEACEFSFTLERKARREDENINAQVLFAFTAGDRTWSADAAYTLSQKDKTMDAQVSFLQGETNLGSLSFTALFASEESEFEISVRDFCFTAPNGRYVSVNSSLKATLLSSAPNPPEGTQHDLFSMTKQEWEEILEALRQGASGYIELFETLF